MTESGRVLSQKLKVKAQLIALASQTKLQPLAQMFHFGISRTSREPPAVVARHQQMSTEQNPLVALVVVCQVMLKAPQVKQGLQLHHRVQLEIRSRRL